ncbi:MAG: ABC transporter ATP-binding protein [Desulfobacteraceae bacterium]|jgi:branched-chain amino acid transport system ATP-binding protein|nr:MAG: ABC transporter ATP-binding protein [Desulfobacteraceae bacterium]
MLKVDKIQASYDDVPALHDVSFEIQEGRIVSIVGSNGAGKSTILKSISGLVRIGSGAIEFNGMRLDRMPPHKVVECGIAHVPEGRRLFARLSVQKNLMLGAFTQKSQDIREKTLKRIFAFFPRLKERENQIAGTLSGGEQQMLAIARGLMLEPKLLMLDEPSLGIMPKLCSEIYEFIKEINREGLTVLLVEQNVQEALRLAHYGYVIQTGRVVAEGTGEKLLGSESVQKAFLGL